MVSCIVIDDNPDIVDLFSDLLNTINVEILATGSNGMDAVTLYEKHVPDVVFTDLQMPKYDGFYAVENIKDKNPNAKIIVITGDLNARYSDILNLFHIPVITKPFNMNLIKQVMTDVFLKGDDSIEPFEIQYKFKETDTVYSCIVTYQQYRNLKNLPIIQECNIITPNQKPTGSYHDEMQKALDLVMQNDTSHILKLSDVVE